MTNNELISKSKALSYALRHGRDTLKLNMDKYGWVEIDEMLEKLKHTKLTRELVEIIVQTNDKQRFSIDGNKIKANQGHSIDIDLDLQPIKPPAHLFHGTATVFIESIKKSGLNKCRRHHVHMTQSEKVAYSVGKRYGKVVILKIDTDQMYKDGYVFYKSINNVWLVDFVPYKYISILN